MKRPTSFSPDDRIASKWSATDNQSFTLDLTVDPTSQPGGRDVSLYFLDWDDNGRSERVEVLDPASGAVLDSRVASGFRHGTYLTWHVTGSVRFRFTKLTGANPVLSGLFVNEDNVSFVNSGDYGIQGNWIGALGTHGYSVAGDTSSLNGDELGFEMDRYTPPVPLVTWPNPDNDPRALQRASDPSQHVAAAWSLYPGWSFDVNVTANTLSGRFVSLYFLDFDSKGRSVRIEVVDPSTDAITDYYDLSNFSGGAYFTWEVMGSAKFRIVPTGGTADNNAVVSGVFFD